MKNIRFWDFINNDLVKITIKPGQKVQHNYFSMTDEGYTFGSICYEYNGQNVLCTVSSGGKDCDGIVKESKVFSWDLLTFHAVCNVETNKEYDCLFPSWQPKDCNCYDLFAEIAGY